LYNKSGNPTPCNIFSHRPAGSEKSIRVNQSNPTERRRLERRNGSFYLPVLEITKKRVFGRLTNIYLIGLMMDSKILLPTNLKYNLRLDLVEEIAGQASLEFVIIRSISRKHCTAFAGGTVFS